jgi:hypothetical protein
LFFVTAVWKRERVFKIGLAVNHAIKNRFGITAYAAAGLGTIERIDNFQPINV